MSVRRVRTPRLLVGMSVVVGLAAWGVTASGPADASGTSSAAGSDRAYATSFEQGQPQPDWTSTVETGPDGNPRAENVTGPTPTGLPGDLTGHVTEVGANGENPPNEIADNLPDGNPYSKWLTFTETGWATYEVDTPVTVKQYALTSANDAPDRDPKDWDFQGSNDGATWTTLDSRSGQDFGKRYEMRTFDVAGDTAYTHYRLRITANHGSGIVQLADWLIGDGSPPEGPHGPMVTEVGGGPTSAYNAKTKVGFTGVKSLHYAGRTSDEQGGHSWEKVLRTHVPVHRSTQLSYKIFPELTGEDLHYPSTYAAVDLHFTDGTYLSDLGAKDQLGFALSPTGQGESKAVYANQWNNRQSLIGEVAAGKTVDRILVGVDVPYGPMDFGGWVDDIELRPTQPQDHAHPTDWVVTTRGTQSNGTFSRGNNIPAAAVPNGFNFLTPATDAGSTSWLYAYNQANDDQNRPRLQALSVSHEPSPWMGDRDTFQLMPSSAPGVPDVDREARSLPFSHDDEVARPDYYGVTFESGLKAEMAPTDHAAVFRFSYPTSDANVILDNVNDDGTITIDPESRSFSGYSDVRAGSDGATRMFVYGEVDRPVTGSGRYAESGRPHTAAYLKVDAGEDRTVTVRLATSYISLDQAKQNLSLEAPEGSTVPRARAQARQQWDDILGRVQVEGATPDQLTTLYSNLYRMYLYPNSGFENVGTADRPKYAHASPVIPAGEPTATHTGAEVVDGKIYVNNGFWDTYRTAWPAYSLLTPGRAAELIDGFVQQYREGGWVSRWSSPGYANLMTGTSSDVAFADAFTKGVPIKDVRSTYEAAVRNATVTPPGNPNNSNVGRKGLQQSIFLGFTPTSVGEGTSWALEGYINDFGIAMMAKRLADQPGISEADRERYRADASYFLDRARNYPLMFDRKVDFFQGFTADHEPSTPASDYSPLDWGGDYTETDGWNFAFHAPQDGQGLANLYGGRQGLADKLDAFFATPETATHPGGYGGIIHEMREARDVRLGQLGLSNQVSHHIPYMYDYAGQPSKTAKIVREAMSRLFSGSQIGQGYAGDEDNGETSAWWLFSAMGFYPLQLGDGHYAVGSPLFTTMTVRMDNGHTLTINALDNSRENVYVTGLRVNGQERNASYIDHDEIAKGGTIDFEMGSTPSSWATGPDGAPPSITQGDQVPQPVLDRTSGDGDVSGVPDAGALFDDTSLTEASVPVGGSVTYQFDRARPLERYTLTSGQGSAPTGWRLEGSADGQVWHTLDERQDESFTWARQTRPFDLGGDEAYAYYRLSVTSSEDDGPASIAEVELAD